MVLVKMQLLGTHQNLFMRTRQGERECRETDRKREEMAECAWGL